MGDLSAEPSMEEILSSIKRIIAEEGEAPGRHRRTPRGSAAAASAPSAQHAMPPHAMPPHALPPHAMPMSASDEVLELSNPMPSMADETTARDVARRIQAIAAPPPADPVDEPTTRSNWAAFEEPMPAPSAAPDRAEPDAEVPIVSPRTADASRGSLDQLSRLLVKPEPGSDGTLEGMVRDMLRPMLRDWLDRNLPPLVETMVAKEIARITAARD